ncbi:MAG: protein kinase [Nitrospiria bacterium]
MKAAPFEVDISSLLRAFSQGITQFFSNVSIAALIGYALLALLVFWGVSLFKRYVAVGKEKTLNPTKVAEQAAKSQDPMLAGELYERAGEYHQAVESYKQARAFRQVGRVYEMMKQWDDAAQFYKISGNAEKAAIMYQRVGAYLHAAECYLSCNKNLLAAEMYEKGREFKEAAIQYEKFGRLLKAGELYKRSKDFEKAAEKYKAFFLKQKVVASNTSPEKYEKIRHAAVESGMLYMKIKSYKNAMDIFSKAEMYEQAGEAAVQAGEMEKAAQFYYATKDFDKAAKLYERLGDRKQSHWMMAKKHQESGDFSAAAKAFENGESWIEAAEMYEQGGDMKGAAKMFQQAGNYHRSADLFLSAGDLSSAAESFEKGGRLQEASDLYVRLKEFDRAAHVQEVIGNYFQAALLLKQQGDLDRCISYLQRVDRDSTNFHEAVLLLGEMLTLRGLTPAAKDCFRKVVSQEAVSSKNIEIYYRLAVLYETEKAFEKSEKLYDAILRKDYNYKDVKDRRDLLKKALEEAKKALAASTPSKRSKSIIKEAGQTTRYKIIKKIGQGGMGVVYLAEDMVLKRDVAYKVLPNAIKENQAVLQNFMQEAQISAALNHPNIVTIFDTGKNGDDIFITMEYVDGITLKVFLERYKASLNELKEIMKSICRGVAYAHNRNVIHRDLKPSNVMLLQDRTVKIMDFGLAKFLTDAMEEKTSVKGTPLYMSPEQIVGEKVDKLSDIYSLGCTFYRLLTGRPPFSKGDIYYQHLHTNASPLRSINPKVPPGLEKIILTCIEKQKGQRFQSTEDIIDAISRLA